MIVLASFVALFVIASVVIDEGDVVHLRTVDSEGVEYEADLWVVDIDGAAYLRASSRDVGWLPRLVAEPRVRLQRDGEWRDYRAVVLDDANAQARVDLAMAEKYGYVESLWDLVVDERETVPIRLYEVSPAEDSP